MDRALDAELTVKNTVGASRHAQGLVCIVVAEKLHLHELMKSGAAAPLHEGLRTDELSEKATRYAVVFSLL